MSLTSSQLGANKNKFTAFKFFVWRYKHSELPLILVFNSSNRRNNVHGRIHKSSFYWNWNRFCFGNRFASFSRSFVSASNYCVFYFECLVIVSLYYILFAWDYFECFFPISKKVKLPWRVQCDEKPHRTIRFLLCRFFLSFVENSTSLRMDDN